MLENEFIIGQEYTKKEIAAIKGKSYIATDHCYNRFCRGGSWSYSKAGKGIIFEYNNLTNKF